MQIIPPQQNAVISNNKEEDGLQRNKAIERIQQVGRSEWKKEAGYHKRSLSEVGMYRYKIIFTGQFQSRKPAYEQTEVKWKCRLLNEMAQLGMPQSYKVAA